MYCLSSKEAELVSAELVSRGVNAGCYHADLEEQAKETNYYNWISNELQVRAFCFSSTPCILPILFYCGGCLVLRGYINQQYGGKIS